MIAAAGLDAADSSQSPSDSMHGFAPEGSGGSRWGVAGSVRKFATTTPKSEQIQRDLQQFLRRNKLLKLIPTLLNLGVKSLEQLKEMDIETLKAALPDRVVLTPDEERRVSERA